jgi:hypothetical protein
VRSVRQLSSSTPRISPNHRALRAGEFDVCTLFYSLQVGDLTQFDRAADHSACRGSARHNRSGDVLQYERKDEILAACCAQPRGADLPALLENNASFTARR